MIPCGWRSWQSGAACRVATIKFYLREGLAARRGTLRRDPGEYDEAHVRRLRLVRALTEVADCGSTTCGRCSPPSTTTRRPGTRPSAAHTPGSRGTGPVRHSPERSLARVEALLDRQACGAREPDTRRLPSWPGRSTPWTASTTRSATTCSTCTPQRCRPIAEHEVAAVRADDPWRRRAVVVGTLLLEPVLLAIRRIAQENVSRQLGQTRPSIGTT